MRDFLSVISLKQINIPDKHDSGMNFDHLKNFRYLFRMDEFGKTLGKCQICLYTERNVIKLRREGYRLSRRYNQKLI